MLKVMGLVSSNAINKVEKCMKQQLISLDEF
jgi:hypothetical protein